MSQVEQLGLEGIQGPKPPSEDRAAFGRFLKTPLYDVFGEYHLNDLTGAQIEWMTPDRIYTELFADGGSKRLDGLYVDGVLLNAYEFNLIPRSPRALGRASMSRVLGDNEVTQEAIERSKRGRVHALEGKRDYMGRHMLLLDARKVHIADLQKAAARPGYTVLPGQTAQHMKILFGEAWQEFTTILDVLQTRREWTDTKRNAANSALINYLTVGPQNQRVGHWQQMLELSRTYLLARTNLFRVRMNQTTDLIAELAPPDVTPAEPPLPFKDSATKITSANA
jgi:hypothetical protein